MLIKKYTSQWIKDFAVLKDEIQTGLPGIAITFEHVGSTSVPYLDSKPIIDIDIVYPRPEDFEKIKSGLEKTGYYHNGNQGIEGREVFKRRPGILNKILDSIPHHLYVCAASSKALEEHILFRDHLRKSEWARLKYEQLKYDLAKASNQDKKKYAELKELKAIEFIIQIIAKEKTKAEQGFDKSGA